MLAVIKRYSFLIVFTLSLLLGLQAPNFLQQYEMRLQGHYAEAKLQLAQFQSLADAYFEGDLQALIQKHKSSQVALFRDEAFVIEQSYLRVQMLQQKIEGIKQPVWQRLSALSHEIADPIVQEAWAGYQANIVLNKQAIVVGLTLAVLVMLLLEFVFYLLKLSFIKGKAIIQQKLSNEHKSDNGKKSIINSNLEK